MKEGFFMSKDPESQNKSHSWIPHFVVRPRSNEIAHTCVNRRWNNQITSGRARAAGDATEMRERVWVNKMK